MRDDITELLQRAGAGDRPALDVLLPMIYGELHRLAHAQRPGAQDTFNTTALVHEAYLKLLDQSRLSWSDRRCFFAYAAKAMRSILIDNARRRSSDKRGGNERRDDDALENLRMEGDSADLLLVEQALDRLGKVSARLREVVELHVFAGLEFKDVAACLGLTERTIFRDWRKARALLQSLLDDQACTS
ncbi:ECF-type sigma factor [Dokdonella soli]|uniref:ECF-type sigma factor n=1 Tax=Dokdonella soli TaxID=529810 RepID=A0ABN1ICV2_9GAMM